MSAQERIARPLLGNARPLPSPSPEPAELRPISNTPSTESRPTQMRQPSARTTIRRLPCQRLSGELGCVSFAFIAPSLAGGFRLFSMSVAARGNLNGDHLKRFAARADSQGRPQRGARSRFGGLMSVEGAFGAERDRAAGPGPRPTRDPRSLVSTRLTRELIASDARSDLEREDLPTRAGH